MSINCSLCVAKEFVSSDDVVFRIGMDFVLNCDLKCLKEILNRQSGGPTHGCFCCDAVTNAFQQRDRVRGTDFTNELILAKSNEWQQKWQVEVGPLVTIANVTEPNFAIGSGRWMFS